MRTTVTLDDDVARELQERARRTGRPFRAVLNEALRRGLSTGEKPKVTKRFRVQARACGFQRGVDLMRLNQVVDELDLDRAAAPAPRRRRA